MAKLTAKARKAQPKSSYGQPANAKGRATQAVNAGRMSPASAARIDAKANHLLGKG
jgi:hypothetical protein